MDLQPRGYGKLYLSISVRHDTVMFPLVVQRTTQKVTLWISLSTRLFPAVSGVVRALFVF